MYLDVAIFPVAALFLVVLILLILYANLHRKYMQLRSEYETLRREFDRRVSTEAQRLAQEMYARWVSTEADRIRKEAAELA